MKKYYEEIFELKNLVRRGWLMRLDNSQRLESDAEHIFSCMMIATKIIQEKKLKLDEHKVLKMLLYHEIGEIEVGDITVCDNVPIKQKYLDEQRAVKKFAKKYNMPEVYLLWEEFEANTTPEAKFCKMIDKLDSVLQAKEYAKKYDNNALYEEFLNTAKTRIFGYEDTIEKYVSTPTNQKLQNRSTKTTKKG